MGTTAAELARMRRLAYGEAFPPPSLPKNEVVDTPAVAKDKLTRLATLAGMSRPALSARLMISAAVSLVPIALTVSISPYLLAAAPVPFLILWVSTRRSIIARAERFEVDYPAFLLALASAVRTGLDPIVAFVRSSALFPPDSLLRQEVEKSGIEIENGTREEDVLAKFASSIAHPDVELFRTAFVLSRKQGSSISQCLQRLVKVTRSRQSFRRKVASAVALQRLSAFGIAGCAVAIAVIQFAGNPDSFLLAMRDPIGSRFVAGGCVCMLGGIGWMLGISRRRI